MSAPDSPGCGSIADLRPLKQVASPTLCLHSDPVPSDTNLMYMATDLSIYELSDHGRTSASVDRPTYAEIPIHEQIGTFRLVASGCFCTRTAAALYLQ